MSGHLIITVGLPGSGKSTWALQQIDLGKADARVNRDELRNALYGKYVLSGSQEAYVTRVQHAAIEQLLAKHLTVIVDDTNLKRKTRTLLRELAYRCGATYGVNDQFLKVSPDRCEDNNVARHLNGDRMVADGVIRSMAKRYASQVSAGRIPEDEERRGHSPTPRVALRLKDAPNAIIVDIDGTVADHNGRDPYAVHKCLDDLVFQDTRHIIKSLMFNHRLIFVSGRDSAYRDLTEQWLNREGFSPYMLYMRSIGDKRDDAVVKLEIYRTHIQPHWNVQAVFDDRDRVVAMWRRLGLQTMQVNYGNF